MGQRKDIPKIVTAETEEELRRTLSRTIAPILAITGPLAKPTTIPAGAKPPIIDIRTKGKKILAIVQKVLVTK